MKPTGTCTEGNAGFYGDDAMETIDLDGDVCVHGRGFDQFCVQCCPEDDDGSFEGDEWSGG